MNSITQNLRNHSSSFVTPVQAHFAWKASSKSLMREASSKHKKVISKAVLRRQGKGYHHIEFADSY